jgi:diadenosine tetraphosphate (Ap4A) HIT family hydrolase
MEHQCQQTRRRPVDLAAYARRSQSGPCFICAIVAGEPDGRHQLLYEDEQTLAFLSRYPTLPGYSLVAPKRHVEDWVHELTAAEFLALQMVVRDLATALAAVLPTERMYSLSLGSRQGNAHLHWHVVPLPPGVPYEQQQYHALMAENGVLDISEQDQAALAAAVRQQLASD